MLLCLPNGHLHVFLSSHRHQRSTWQQLMSQETFFIVNYKNYAGILCCCLTENLTFKFAVVTVWTFGVNLIRVTAVLIIWPDNITHCLQSGDNSSFCSSDVDRQSLIGLFLGVWVRIKSSSVSLGGTKHPYRNIKFKYKSKDITSKYRDKLWLLHFLILNSKTIN